MELLTSNLLERAAAKTYIPESVSWAQLEPGTFEARYGSIEADPLTLTLRRFNLGFTSQALVTPQTAMIAIGADFRTNARWFGARIPDGGIAMSRGSIELSTTGPASFYSFSIDLASLARRFFDAPDALALLEGSEPNGMIVDPVSVQRLRALMDRVFSVGGPTTRRLIQQVLPRPSIYGTLIPLLATATARFRTHAIEPSKALNRRLRAVRICERYMREHVDSSVTVLDLARVSGMRSRTLINAFLAVTGFSPINYLKRLRLSGVRRALQRADEARTRVIDVATEWGFWHMGHFTMDYRTMFGETPSQTLRG